VFEIDKYHNGSIFRDLTREKPLIWENAKDIQIARHLICVQSMIPIFAKNASDAKTRNFTANTGPHAPFILLRKKDLARKIDRED